MQYFVCKSKIRRRKRAVHWDEWRTKTFSRHRNPTTGLVDAGFEQEALKALEKLDAVQPVVPTTGDAARDETADV